MSGNRRCLRAFGAIFVLAGCALAGLVVCSGCGTKSAAQGPRNLLFVLFDTTRADRLSCYGYAQPTTPTIDRLAAEGTRFENVWAQSSLTPVAASSLFTGTLPFRHGVRSLFDVQEAKISTAVPNLFESLRMSGRRTAGFVSAKPMGAHYGLGRGFDVYDDDLTATAQRHALQGFLDAPQRPADETADRALDWLGRHGREPFALALHFFDTHDPSFIPPRAFLEQQGNLPKIDSDARATNPASHGALYRREVVPVLYDAELRFMDAQLQRVLDKLDALGVRQDTLIIVVADHGEAFGERGFWTHGQLYEEQLRVPLVWNGPGIPRGRRIAERAAQVDVYPTLVEIFGLPAAKGQTVASDGRSLAGLLRGDAGAKLDGVALYAEVHHAPKDRLRRESAMYALRIKDWKYIHRPISGRHELFNLAEDPLELHNLYSAEHPMAKVLALRLEALGAVSGKGVSLEGLSEEEKARLRALGYLGEDS